MVSLGVLMIVAGGWGAFCGALEGVFETSFPAVVSFAALLVGLGVVIGQCH